MRTKSELIEEMKGELAAARAISAKADETGRGYTDDETATITRHVDTAKNLKSRIDRIDTDAAVKSAISELGNSIGLGDGAKGDQRPAWAVKGRGRSEWVKNTVAQIEKASGQLDAHGEPTGAKSIITGSVGVPSPIFTDITKLAPVPTRLLDLLVDRVPLAGTNTFSFLRQTVRTNNAAPVADNALKPTSVYTFGEVEDRVRVIAHLSEAIPERFLSDHADLGDFLQSEMEEGLYRALEAQVLSGSGTGENMTGILSTSGIITQAWSTDLLTTLRKAATALELVGEVPTAWAIHPSDVETLDLLQDNEARHYFAGPSQQLAQTSPVWSLPIVKSTAVAAGTALLADWNYVRLVVREDTRLDIDRSGDLFTNNQFKARLEGRFGVAVRRPTAFCKVTTVGA